MTIYRLGNGSYASDLSGEGAKLFGGRWNSVGRSSLYTSEYISLCILEILAKASRHTTPDNYTLLTLEIPENLSSEIKLNKLKENWQIHLEYTRFIGDEFLKENEKLTLKVPSAIVPQEHNFLINPLHKDFKKVKIISTELLNLDKRLLAQ